MNTKYPLSYKFSNSVNNGCSKLTTGNSKVARGGEKVCRDRQQNNPERACGCGIMIPSAWAVQTLRHHLTPSPYRKYPLAD